MAKSFVSEDVGGVNCPSSWESNRSCHDGSAQTTNLTFSESGTQCTSYHSTEVQTEGTPSNDQSRVDMAKLATWLNRITPKVLEELDKSCKTRAFDEYQLQDTMESTIKHLCTYRLEPNHQQYNFFTSAMDWSCTGGTLAISRCAKDHPSWCEHPGIIFLHRTAKQVTKPELQIRSLDVSSCVTALCAHPTDSFILACGTFSGEVAVWNLQTDEAQMIGSLTVHSEAVCHLQWIQNFDLTAQRPVLASASRDGTVVVWTIKSTSDSLRVLRCFLLQADKVDLDLGIVCAKFNPCNPTMFLAGVEGGSVVVCSAESKKLCRGKQTWKNKELEFFDPVLNILDGHKGAITGAQWLTGKSDIFITCGTDAELHIYSVTEFILVRIIHLAEPSYGLEVIPNHPHVVVTWDSSGLIHLHDVNSSREFPSLGLESENGNMHVTALRIRSTSSLLFALGCMDGKVAVWQVSHQKLNASFEL